MDTPLLVRNVDGNDVPAGIKLTSVSDAINATITPAAVLSVGYAPLFAMIRVNAPSAIPLPLKQIP